MTRSGAILMFLVISLFVMLAYAAVNFFVTSHAEEVISRAPKVDEVAVTNMAEAACRTVQDRYDDLVDNPPADGNTERRELDVEIALAQIERVCE